MILCVYISSFHLPCTLKNHFFRPFPPKRGKQSDAYEKKKVCVLEVKTEEQGLVFHYGSYEEVEIRCCHNEGISEISLGHGAYRQSDRS